MIRVRSLAVHCAREFVRPMSMGRGGGERGTVPWRTLSDSSHEKRSEPTESNVQMAHAIGGEVAQRELKCAETAATDKLERDQRGDKGFRRGRQQWDVSMSMGSLVHTVIMFNGRVGTRMPSKNKLCSIYRYIDIIRYGYDLLLVYCDTSIRTAVYKCRAMIALELYSYATYCCRTCCIIVSC